MVAWHPNLIKLNTWLIGEVGKVVYTSGYRSDRIHGKDSGIHTTNPLRAVDIRHYIYYDPERLEEDSYQKYTIWTGALDNR